MSRLFYNKTLFSEKNYCLSFWTIFSTNTAQNYIYYIIANEIWYYSALVAKFSACTAPLWFTISFKYLWLKYSSSSPQLKVIFVKETFAHASTPTSGLMHVETVHTTSVAFFCFTVSLLQIGVASWKLIDNLDYLQHLVLKYVFTHKNYSIRCFNVTAMWFEPAVA